MIGRFSLAGSDRLEVPAFFDTGDAAALARWKREHPDWFEAGRWTPGFGSTPKEKRAAMRAILARRGDAPTA